MTLASVYDVQTKARAKRELKKEKIHVPGSFVVCCLTLFCFTTAQVKCESVDVKSVHVRFYLSLSYIW